jgi:hypothetical protein
LQQGRWLRACERDALHVMLNGMLVTDVSVIHTVPIVWNMTTVVCTHAGAECVNLQGKWVACTGMHGCSKLSAGTALSRRGIDLSTQRVLPSSCS